MESTNKKQGGTAKLLSLTTNVSISIMLQNKDFQPTQGLQPYAKCADCPMFSDFQDSRNRGWCSAFEKLFQKALETVDLVFLDGIDWKAFLLSLKELQNEYGQENVDVQGIEKRPGGTFVIRIDAPPEVNLLMDAMSLQ